MGLQQFLNQLTTRWLGKPLTRIVDYCVGIPVVNTLASLRRRHRVWPKNVRRVGVFCSPTMGDTVLFSAVLLDLRAHFPPDVDIIHICGEKNILCAQLLEGVTSRVVVNLTRPLVAARQIRAERLDLYFDFSSWQRVTAGLALTSGSRFTVGFRSIGNHRERAYDQVIPHRVDQHELENFRDLLRGVGIPTFTTPRVSVLDIELTEPWHSARDIVIFHPWPAGGPQSMREWPGECWAAIAKPLAQADTLFAITGSPGERARSEAFAERLMNETGVRTVVFTGGDGLRQLVTLLRKARLVVSVNTGVMHLAAVVGAPTVSLNGPTAEHRWGPRGRCCVSVAPGDGSGGYLRFGHDFRRGAPDVMAKIIPDQVLNAAHQLLAACESPAPNKTMNHE